MTASWEALFDRAAAIDQSFDTETIRAELERERERRRRQTGQGSGNEETDA